MKKIIITSALTGALAVCVVAGPIATTAADAASTYKNCTAMNKGKYPHGVAKKGAVDKTSGKKVTTFKVDSKVYKKYSTSKSKGGYGDLDRDNDGIACERK